MKKIFATLALILVLSTSIFAQSHLEQVSAATVAGQFSILNQPGDGSGYDTTLTASGIGTIYGYASTAGWEPNHDRIFYMGAGHNGGSGNPVKFLAYESAANQWSILPTPPWASGWAGNSHAYRLQAIANDGEYVKVRTNTYQTFNCDLNKADLADIPTCPGDYPDPGSSTLVSYLRGPLAAFPDRDSFIYINQLTARLQEKVKSASAWTTYPVVINGIAGFDGIASAYSPTQHVVVFGGGRMQLGNGTIVDNFKWYKIDSAGTISSIDDAPISSTATGSALFAADPVSGKFILIRPNAYTAPTGFFFYELDLTKPAGSQWVRRTDLEANVPQFYAGGNGQQINNLVNATVSVSVPEAGGIVFMGRERVWFYKHTALELPPPPPDPDIAAPIISLVGAPSLTITWVTDEPATSQVEYGIDATYGTATPQTTELVTAHSVTITDLQPGTTYHLRVHSVDVAGNPVAPSEGSSDYVFTTLAPSTEPPPPPIPPDPPLGMNFEEKCKQPGVLGCWAFDDDPELRYAWNRNNAALEAAMIAEGHPWRSISRMRNAGEGNTYATQQITGALSIPRIDKEVFHSGGGSLRFDVTSQSGPDVGYFQDNFNKTLGNPSFYISPESPHGNVIYLQYQCRVNDVMLDTNFRQAVYLFNLTTPAPGATTINTNYAAFVAAMVGRKIIMSPNGNWTGGFYEIKEVLNDRSVVVDRTPTPKAAGTSTLAQLSDGGNAGGWKVDIIFGNSPNGASSSQTEITLNDLWQTGFPAMYGQQGLDSPGSAQNTTAPFLRNQFQEITIRIEMIGGSNERTNHVTWWLNGKLIGDWLNAKAAWGPDYGFGQFMLTPYHTRKDATQEHGLGQMWFDSVIVSKQPIAM